MSRCIIVTRRLACSAKRFLQISSQNSSQLMQTSGENSRVFEHVYQIDLGSLLEGEKGRGLPLHRDLLVSVLLCHHLLCDFSYLRTRSQKREFRFVSCDACRTLEDKLGVKMGALERVDPCSAGTS